MAKHLLFILCFLFCFNRIQAKNATKNPYLDPNNEFHSILPTKEKKDDFSFLQNNNTQEQEKQQQIAAHSFDELEKTGNFTQLINPNELTSLPIGIKESRNNVEYAIVVTKVRFTPEYALIDVFARIRTPQQGAEGGKKDLYFGAEGVKLSYGGKIIGDAKLSLLGEVHIPFNDKKWMLTLEGGSINKNTGNASNDNTYVIIDCDGIKELSLKGNIQISREVVVPISPDTGALAEEYIKIGNKSVLNRVRGDFSIKASDWNDIIVKVSLSPFAITSHTKNSDRGYFTFLVSNAVLDLSDLRNDPSVTFPNYYHKQGYFIAGAESWRGLFVESLQVGLPKEFKTTKNPNKPITLAAELLLIDQYGVSGKFSANNVFPLEEGITAEEKAWAYSLDKIGVDLAASRIIGANIEGEIRLPVQKLNKSGKALGYKGLFTEEEYLLSVKLQDAIPFDVFKARAVIHSGSSIELKVKKRRFYPKAILSGELSIAANKKENDANAQNTSETSQNNKTLEFKGIKFQNLVLQTESPNISVSYFGVKGEQKLANFPVSIKDIELRVSRDQRTDLSFGITVGLQDKGFSASGGINIFGQITNDKRRQQWEYDGFSLSRLELNKVDINVATVSGFLELMDNDPTYGRGFRAYLNADISALSNLNVEVNAIFGRSTFRYWGFEGSVNNIKQPPTPTLIKITGFSGGAFYRMVPDDISIHPELKSQSINFTPNEKVGLHLRANVYGAIKDEKIANMMAGFSISTNPNGGLANIGFVGEAYVMTDLTAVVPNPFSDIQSKLSDYVKNDKFAKQVVGNNRVKTFLDTSDTDDYYPTKINTNANLYAKLAMNYDFNNKVFHATLDTYVNSTGGFIRGVGNNGRAGWAVLHLAPKEWYLHIGSPTDMIGLKVGIGNFYVQTGSYFMVGNRIPGSPPPPAEVAQILGVQLKDLDYMRDLNALGDGKGFAFGTHLKFDTGDMTALILYARFQAGIGADIMLKNYGEAKCSNRGGSHIGINGWYANGQAYAYLQGELGIKIKLFFVRKKIPIIKAGAATLLQVKAPNPFWMRGYLGGYYELLGGLVKGRFRFKLEFGEECKLENESVLGGVKIITDVTPKKEDTGVDVFAIPQATFAFKVNEPIVIPEDDGDHTYKILVDKFSVIDEDGKEIKGRIEYGKVADVANFISDDILPPNKKLKAIVEVSFMEKKNGLFQTMMVDGKKATEREERNFTTGTAPNTIPLTNILYAYPVVEQQNYYLKESNKGYIKLKRGQDYLFDDPNWKTSIQFKSEKDKVKEVDFAYDDTENTILFSTPSLQKQEKYHLHIIAKNNTTKPTNTNHNQVHTEEKMDSSDDESGVSSSIVKKEAQELSKDGQIERLTFHFRTSKYNTFERKLEALRFNTVRNHISTGLVFLKNYINTDEYFDETELIGSAYTDHKPLIDVSALMDDPFAEKFKNLFYHHYPLDNITLYRADDDENNVGIPPIKAMPIQSSYLLLVRDQPEHSILKTTFPYQYDLFRYYMKDWYELVSKAANKYINTNADSRPNKINELLSSSFGIIPAGKYKVLFQYIMPGQKKGTEKNVDYQIKKD